MNWIYTVGIGILIYFGLSNCKPNGAPSESCFYMTPRHIHPHTFRKVFPTRAMGLYNITTSADIFRPDRPIRVTLWGPPFKGFMMVAAEEGAKDWPTGIFYSDDGAAKRLSCLSRGDTVTHQNNSYKDSVSVLWYGPENMMSEQIQFIATVVVNLTIYYTNIKSGFLRLDPTLHAAGAGGENGPLPVTMDPWLSGQSATQAPVNWWSRGAGAGAAGGGGRNGLLNSLGSLLGLGGGASGGANGGGNTWGSGSSGGSTWFGSGSGSSSGSGSGSNTWSSGGDWQQYGDGSVTSRSTWGAAGNTGGSSWGQQSGQQSWGSGGGSGSSWGDTQSNSWGSSGGTWGSGGSASPSNSWGSSGGSWGSGGSASPSNTGTNAPANVPPAASAGGASIWTWNSGPSTQAPPVRTTQAPPQTPAPASAWSVDNLINLLKQLRPSGTQGTSSSV